MCTFRLLFQLNTLSVTAAESPDLLQPGYVHLYCDDLIVNSSAKNAPVRRYDRL